MPIKEKVVEDFQHLWSEYDKKATGLITVAQLDLLLVDLANAAPDWAGALIPFKKRMRDDGPVGKEFRNR